MIQVRRVFGHGARSFDVTRSVLNLNRPASIRQMRDPYLQDMVFDEPIITSDGVDLGGHQTLTVRNDGTFRWRGHMRATGLQSFEFAIITALVHPIALPDGTSATSRIVFAESGEVHGSNKPGDRVFAWDQQSENKLLRSEWLGVRQGRIEHRLEFDNDLFGVVGDVVSFLAQVVALGATFGAAGVALVVAGKAAALLNVDQIVLPGMIGVLFSAGAAFVFGPVAMFPALVVGAVTAAALIRQREMTPEERAFADQVFAGKIRYDRVRLTNLVGVGERPFTAPGPGKTILVNLGKGFDSPTTYTGLGGEATGIRAPGQLLIHELTHAWQYLHHSFTPEFYCRALITAIGTTGADKSAYNYGPAGFEWQSFGTEQQASVVDEWFAGNRMPLGVRPQQPQVGFQPMEIDDGKNPYAHYILDEVRSGQV